MIFGMSDVAIYATKIRYKIPAMTAQLPQRHVGAVTASRGDSRKAVLIATPNQLKERKMPFWQHLPLSGFVGGDTSTTNSPQNAGGGVLQAQNGAWLGRLVICTTPIHPKIANAIDLDGRWQTK